MVFSAAPRRISQKCSKSLVRAQDVVSYKNHTPCVVRQVHLHSIDISKELEMCSIYLPPKTQAKSFIDQKVKEKKIAAETIVRFRRPSKT
jgi:hypothetical protein